MGLNQEARKIRFFHSKEEPHKIKDTLDIKRQQAENTWTWGTSLLGLVSSTIASELFVRNAFPGKPLDSYYLGMAGYASIQTLYNFVQAKRLESQAKKIAKEHVISNTQLGFRAEKFYTGKAVEVGNCRLQSGDPFYYVYMPGYTLPDNDFLSQEQNVTMRKLHMLIYQTLGKDLEEKNYKAIFIEPPGAKEIKSGLFKNDKSRRELFAGKEIPIQDEDIHASVFTKEEFERLSVNMNTQSEVVINPNLVFFNLGIEELHKEIVGRNKRSSILLEQYKAFLTEQGDKRIEMKQKLKQSLTGIFKDQTTFLFSGDRFSGRISRIEKKSGYMYKTSFEPGSVRKISDIHLDQSVPEIIQEINENPNYKKQTALLLSSKLIDMIDHESLDQHTIKTVKSSPFAKEEIIKELEEQNISLVPFNHKDNGIVEQKKLHITKSLLKKMGPFISTFLVAGALKTGGLLFELRNYTYALNDSHATEQVTLSQKPGFTGIEIQPRIDWMIEPHGLDPYGYYIRSTSSNYDKGVWKYNEEVLRTLHLPPDLSERNTPHLKLTGKIYLDPFGNATIKFPVQAETDLSALHIIDIDQNPLPYTAYKLTDGTVKIDIAGGLSNTFNRVSIEGSLTSSSQSVHASRRMKKIDRNKLSDTVTTAVENTNSLHDLADEIQSDHIYTKDPANKGGLEEGNNDIPPEDFVNKAADLKGVQCIIANSEFAFLSTLKQRENFVNIAYGDVLNQMQNDTFALNTETSHAFTVSNENEVIDATSGITIVRKNSLKSEDMTNTAKNQRKVFEKQEKEFSQKRDIIMKIKELMIPILIGTGGTLTGRGIQKLLSKKNKERKNKKSEQPAPFTPEILKLVYDFLQWKLWKKSEKETPFMPAKILKGIDKPVTIEDIKNILYRDFYLYEKNPQVYITEPGFDPNLAAPIKDVFDFIARYNKQKNNSRR